MAADIEEVIARTAIEAFKEARAETQGLAADLVPAIKNARDLSQALMGVNSSGQLVKAYNEAAAAHNKVADGLDKITAANERAIAAEKKAQQAREKAEAAYLKQQDARAVADSKAANEYQRRKDKEAATAEKAASRQAAAAEKAAQQEAKATEVLLNDYALLSKAYNEAALRAKNLQLQQGSGNATVKEAIDFANQLGNKLKALDASVGQNQRNVGNYASGFSGLSNSIQQILREAPSAAVSLNTFFLAISNNLPIFFDEITKINKAQQEAKVLAQEQILLARESATAQALQAGATAEMAAAQGALAAETTAANAASKAQPSVLSQIGKSILSVNTLLTLGVLALTLFGGKAVSAIEGLFGITEQSKKAAAELKKYNDSIDQISKTEQAAAAREIAHLNTLLSVAKDVEQSSYNRKQAALELAKTYPDRFANLTQEAILEGRVGSAVEETTKAILARANVSAAEKKIGAAAEKVFELNEQLKENIAQQKELSKLDLNSDPFTGSRSGFSNFTDKNRLSALKSEAKVLTDQLSALRKQQQGYAADIQVSSKEAADAIFKGGNAPAGSVSALRQQITETKQLLELKKVGSADQIALTKKLAEQEKQLRIIEGGSDKPRKKKVTRDNTNENLKILQDQTKAEADEDAKQLQLKAENERLIIEDEAKSLQVRLDAIQAFYGYTKKALIAKNKGEQDEVKKGLEAIAKLEARGGKFTQEEQDLLSKKKLFNQQLVNINLDGQIAEKKNERARAKERLSALKDASQDEIKQGELNAAHLIELRSEQLNTDNDNLKEALDNGKITRKQYNQSILSLQRGFASDILRIQIDELEKTIDTGLLTRDDYDKTIKKIEELQTQLNKKPKSSDSKNPLGLSDEGIKTLNEYLALTEKAGELINDVFNIQKAQFDARMAQLDAEGAKIDKNLDKRIFGIKAEGLTAEETQKKISQAEAEAQSQRERLESQQADLRRKAARAERAQTIVSIITSTALAVVRQLTAIPPGPQNLALAAIVGAIGAAQLAAVLSTSVPAYATGAGIDGKPAHKSGLARVGDGKFNGKPERELIMEPGKDPYMVAHDHIRLLAPGSRVIPEHRIMNTAYASLTPQMIISLTQQKSDNRDVVREIRQNSAKEREILMRLIPKQVHKESAAFQMWRNKWV